MSNSITGGLAELAARRTAAKRAAAQVVYAKTVAALAAGRSFSDGELDEIADALGTLGIPPGTADEDAALLAGYPAQKAAVEAMPDAEQAAEMRKKLLAELVQAEGENVVGARTGQVSGDTMNRLAALRLRVNAFGQEWERQRHRFREVSARLAPIFAHLPAEPTAEKPTPEKPATGGKRATAAAK